MESFARGRVIKVVSAIAVVSSLVLLAVASTTTARVVKWQEAVVVYGPGSYQCLDLATGTDGVYIVTWEYPAGRVLLFKSVDGGATWGAPVDVFGMSLYPGYSSMCVYQDGEEDTILVVSGPKYVAKSVDSGETFQRLANVPVPDYGTWYCTSAIGTNASWFGGEGDDDLYFVGALYVGVPWSGKYVLHSSVSHDGGASWEAPVAVSPVDYESFWPELFSDGQRLYATHAVANSVVVHLKYSEDWGATWTDGGDLAEAEGTGGLIALKVQPIDSHRAFMTLWNVPEPGGVGTARCGYFSYDDMTFKETFRVDNPDWQFGRFGLSVEMVSMSEFRVAGLDLIEFGAYDIIFANSQNLE